MATVWIIFAALPPKICDHCDPQGNIAAAVVVVPGQGATGPQPMYWAIGEGGVAIAIMLRSLTLSSPRRLRRFVVEDEDAGAATVEFTIWIPLFFVILGLAIDVCTLMLSQVMMYETASDTARRWAIGEIATEVQAKEYAASAGTLRGSSPDVSKTRSDDTTVTVSLAFPMRTLSIVGIVDVLTQGEMEVSVVRAKIRPGMAASMVSKTAAGLTLAPAK